jgi:hypothetical protein
MNLYGFLIPSGGAAAKKWVDTRDWLNKRSVARKLDFKQIGHLIPSTTFFVRGIGIKCRRVTDSDRPRVAD